MIKLETRDERLFPLILHIHCLSLSQTHARVHDCTKGTFNYVQYLQKPTFVESVWGGQVFASVRAHARVRARVRVRVRVRVCECACALATR